MQVDDNVETVFLRPLQCRPEVRVRAANIRRDRVALRYSSVPQRYSERALSQHHQVLLNVPNVVQACITDPAKSSSTINVDQCFFRAASATSGSCCCPRVYLSIILSFPVA